MTDTIAPHSSQNEFIFLSTSDGIITASEGIVEKINPAGAGMLGIMPEDVIGKPVKKAFEANPALVSLFTRTGEHSLDIRLPRRRLAVGIANTLADESRIVILHDVTERRDLESRREALIRALNHDLRNPITGISGFADLVVKFGDLNEQQAKFITRIKQTAIKIHDVINTLVDLAWIEAGMPLMYQPIQLRDIINKAVKRLVGIAQERKIIIVSSVQNPMPIIMGDAERLEQVVYNLLHNAILYSHTEQTVAIHAWGNQDKVYCSVADRGIGISDDEIDMVFDRMFRSRSEVVRNIPGGGLGLTLARTIVRRHGGDITVTSHFGEGSTFTLIIPTVASESKSA
ncbi:MAG: ATP-binding protein [Anaerolineae bacterium]|jgi:signal transduction histidine kinase|nr:ATP-binding protein [Anaerolineae bacterium]